MSTANHPNTAGSQERTRDWFTLLLGVGCIVGAAWLFWGVRDYKPPNVSVSIAQLKARQASLEDDLSSAEVHLVNAKDDFAKQVEPGPEPSRWHPIDHWAWDNRKQA